MNKKEDSKLRERLTPFADCLESRLSVRACIMKHASLLLKLREEGYKVDDILELSGCTYSRQSFSNTLSQVRQKTDRGAVKKTVSNPSAALEKQQKSSPTDQAKDKIEL